ncbi:hypothetical protein ACFYUJ_21015 [Streptomyces sp. NPDC004520]|uniref:hypothetical protein n=1 Tax=Streptomyces sp. NPDC004520 TaxID=3364702 RepID=UPI0036754893
MNNQLIPMPQLGAAMALTQLLRENEHLPLLDWTVTVQGELSGQIANEYVDMRAVIGKYAERLGGQPHESRYPHHDGTPMYTATLATTWRDVTVLVTVVGRASLVRPAVPR